MSMTRAAISSQEDSTTNPSVPRSLDAKLKNLRAKLQPSHNGGKQIYGIMESGSFMRGGDNLLSPNINPKTNNPFDTKPIPQSSAASMMSTAPLMAKMFQAQQQQQQQEALMQQQQQQQKQKPKRQSNIPSIKVLADDALPNSPSSCFKKIEEFSSKPTLLSPLPEVAVDTLSFITKKPKPEKQAPVQIAAQEEDKRQPLDHREEPAASMQVPQVSDIAAGLDEKLRRLNSDFITGKPTNGPVKKVTPTKEEPKQKEQQQSEAKVEAKQEPKPVVKPVRKSAEKSKEKSSKTEESTKKRKKRSDSESEDEAPKKKSKKKPKLTKKEEKELQKQKEQAEKEQKAKEQKEKEQRDKERKEKEQREKEQREKEQKEKEQREREQKERDLIEEQKRELEELRREKRERDEREKREKEEKEEREEKERKERKERERKDKEDRDKDGRSRRRSDEYSTRSPRSSSSSRERSSRDKSPHRSSERRSSRSDSREGSPRDRRRSPDRRRRSPDRADKKSPRSDDRRRDSKDRGSSRSRSSNGEKSPRNNSRERSSRDRSPRHSSERRSSRDESRDKSPSRKDLKRERSSTDDDDRKPKKIKINEELKKPSPVAKPSPSSNGTAPSISPTASRMRWQDKQKLAKNIKHKADRYNQTGERSKAFLTYIQSGVMFLESAAAVEKEERDLNVAIDLYFTTYKFLESIVQNWIRNQDPAITNSKSIVPDAKIGLGYLAIAVSAFKSFLLRKDSLRKINREIAVQQSQLAKDSKKDIALATDGGLSKTLTKYLDGTAALHVAFDCLEKSERYLPEHIKPTPLHANLWACDVAEVLKFISSCLSALDTDI